VIQARFFALMASAAFCIAPAFADATPGTLWIGNDTNAGAGILNMTTTGTLLRSIPNTSGIGFAIDESTNSLYVNNSGGGGSIYNLDTLAITGSFTLPNASEDMTFSGGYIWSGNFGGHAIDKVDPATGNRVGGFSVGYSPLGLTTDGSGGFWVSEFSSTATTLHHYDSAGNEIGTMDPTDISSFSGGLAYDPGDGTLYIGNFNSVYHYTTAGVDLGSFSTGDSRFVDGLEFSAGGASVPEPKQVVVLGAMFLLIAFTARRRLSNKSV
jgi:hypothetical protein